MEITNLQEVYDLTFAGRELQSAAKDFASKPTQTVHLYYDVEVIKDPSQRYGPLLIEEIRSRHYKTLQDLQEYTDSKGYYFMSNVVCAPFPPQGQHVIQNLTDAH
jgi:hypothetical protein